LKDQFHQILNSKQKERKQSS